MDPTIEAIYENGVLRPIQPLTGLQNGEKVRLHLECCDLSAPVAIDEQDRAFLDHMEQQRKLVRWPKPKYLPDPSYQPIVVGGSPLSQTLVEDRR